MTLSPELSASKVAILGLGLMGGSLALALRGRISASFAYDPDPSTRALALQEHIVDRVADDPAEILPEADVVLLAAPVKAIIEWIALLPGLHPGRAVVLDLGSTKAQICAALEDLPDRFDPVGGHPMCGKAVAGLEHAEATIFQGAQFAFTPLGRTTQHARSVANELASTVGAKPLWIDPHTHDQWVAATSHLPYLLSCALALATPLEVAPLVGPGFRSTSRLATSSLAMTLDFLSTNKTNVLACLERFRVELDRLGTHLTEDGPDLIKSLQLAAEHQRALMGVNRIPKLKETQ